MPSLNELEKRKEEITNLFSNPDVAANPERLKALSFEFSEIQRQIASLLAPSISPVAFSDSIIEIRAGTGGEEAGLFAGDLFRMYEKFALKKKLADKPY